ncbi:MAG: hypothetical protein M3Z23_11635 [Acidobacteriota bacterium]|nr:hypothetical protein [Acidobacteriota bacterium]
MKNLTLAVLALLGTFAFAASAADVTGKWTADMPGRQGNTMTATFDLKADGDKLTGTVSTQAGENPIEDGKISGNDLSFKQKMSFNGNDAVILYTGKMDGDKINFTRQREGADRKTEFVAKRSTT